jgi:hypothetical protein
MLHELHHQFGNLGLAAAAYNAGPRRVQDWIQGHAKLPDETKRYVAKITGRSAHEWFRAGVVDQADTTKEDRVSCDATAHRPPVVLKTQVGTEGSAYWFRVRITERDARGCDGIVHQIASEGWQLPLS